jgi:hypothetical protein
VEGVSVTIAVALLVGSATLVTMTVVVSCTLTVGATKLTLRPLPEIDPLAASQVTAVFAVPVTVALNDCEPFETTVAVVGEISIVTAGPTGPVLDIFIVH